MVSKEISFNELLKSFTIKERNNLKKLFEREEFPQEILFREVDKSIISSYPSSSKKLIIIVKSNWESISQTRGNTIINFVIYGHPSYHYLSIFGNGTKIFGDVTMYSRNQYSLSKIEESAVKVWIAEVGCANIIGENAKIKPELSFKENYNILFNEIKNSISRIKIENYNDINSLSNNLENIYEYLKVYDELGRKIDNGIITKMDVAEIECFFNGCMRFINSTK